MARSSYIYVVTENGMVSAAFTVKYELVSWLENRKNFGSYIRIVRVRSGVMGSVTDITNECLIK